MFKKYILLLLTLLSSISFFAQLEFKGQLPATNTITELYLYKYIGMKAYPFDTIVVKKNKFSKTYPKFDKGLYVLGIGEEREEIVLTENVVDIQIPVPLTEMPWKLSSLANADYFEIRNQIRQYDADLKGLDAQFRNFEYLAQTDPSEFNRRIGLLRQSLDSSNAAMDLFFNGLVTSAKSEYGKNIAKFMALTASTNKSNYFNSTELKNTQLASGDFILRKLNYYFMRFGRLDESNIALESQTLLSYAKEKNLCRELMFEGIINNAVAVSETQTRALFMQYKAEFSDTSQVAKRMKSLIPAAAPEIGGMAPEIEAVDKDGKMFKLSDLRGKVVLIDFWAAWCGPCRRESPNVVANYNKYKDKGFTIVSISADKDRNAWLNAIKQDNYVWENHLLSLDQNYKAQQDFHVQGYPTMFLIDRDGKIITFGNSLRGAGLSNTLASVFAQ